MFTFLKRIFRGFYRLCFLFYAFFGFLIETTLCRWRYKDEVTLYKALIGTTSKYCRRALSTFNVKVSIKGNFDPSKTYMIVANHLSYKDIIILSSHAEATFISHTGMKKERLVGNFTVNSGSILVDRGSRANLLKEIKRVGEMLTKGLTIALFPEATTCNGDKIYPFHSALMDAAIISKTPILPVCIQYKTFNGEPITLKNRDQIYIYGKRPFEPHILNLFWNLDTVETELYFFDPIPTDTGMTRKEISDMAHKLISEKFVAITH